MIDKLYIPTYRRAKQPTWNNLPKKWQDKTVLVVDEEDNERLKKNYNTLVCPVQGQGIPKVFPWILKHARDVDKKVKIGYLDDDILDFVKTRREGEEGLWNTRISPDEYDQMFACMDEYLDDVVTCSLEVCWNPPISKYDKHICFRQTCNHFFNMKEFPLEMIDWNINFTEDYYMLLQLLTNGYQNYVSLRWRIRPDVTQAAGGCSSIRTLEGHNESMLFLEKKYPDFVKTYEKAQKVGKEWAGKPKLAAEIAWKKAYKSSIKSKHASLEDFFA